MKLFYKYARLIPFFVLAVIVASCGDDDDEENLPEIIAGFTQTINQNTGTVTFINISENADTYSWDFGDGTTSTEINPVKTYVNGDYTVVLTANNSAGASKTAEDTFTILIPEPASLPITFDADNTLYEAETFNGTAFAVVPNPAQGGTNDKAGNVGEITNSGQAFEGIAITLGTSVDLTNGQGIEMNFWSEAAVDVLLKLEITESNFVETTASHGGSGWETVSFNYTSSESYPKLVIFVDGPGTTSGAFYIDDIVQAGVIGALPVISLTGDATVTLTVGDTFTDPGASASDAEDGDLTSEIIVGGDAVDVNAAGTYTITYNVSDSDGNNAAEVTRTVIVEEPTAFDDGLLTNGDFEAGADPWLSGVGTDPAPIVTMDGNTYYSVDITTPDPGQPFLVNLSQKLPLTAGESYVLTFDAWSDRSRTIIAGIGRSGGDFANVAETVSITDTRTTYTASFASIGFGEADNRVLFDSNGEAGLVNIDNVRLEVDAGGGGDTTPPVITLNGDATINIIEGDAFTDPGATAMDNVDGDISGSIVVAGDVVDNSTVGMYVITYNVSDAASNAATQVTRTVNVNAFDAGLLTNGSFQAGAAPWLSGVGTDPAPVVTMNGNTYYSVDITTPDPGQPFLVNLSQKLALTAGESYVLTFDAWSDRSRTIIAGIGRSGGDFANVSETVSITDTRTTYTASFASIGFGEADNRVLFDSNGEAGLVNIDNVKLEVDGGGGGGSCDPPAGDLVSNGGFETGDDCGWDLFQNGGTAEIDGTNNNGGSFSGKLATGGPSNPAFKQERIGAGTVQAGDVVRISFDHTGAVVAPGGVFNVLLFGEGAAGASFTHVFNPAPMLGASWVNFTGDFTIPGGTDVSEGISFLIEAVCGGDAGCSVSANIDNVSVTLNP